MEYPLFFSNFVTLISTLTLRKTETIQPIEKIQTHKEPVNGFLHFTRLMCESIFNNKNFPRDVTFRGFTAAVTFRPRKKLARVCDITYNFNPSYPCWKLSYRNDLNRLWTSKLFSTFHSLDECLSLIIKFLSRCYFPRFNAGRNIHPPETRTHVYGTLLTSPSNSIRHTPVKNYRIEII